MLSNTELAYLAGFIDGEGCISILKTKSGGTRKSPAYRLEVVVTQAGEEGNMCLQYWVDKTKMGRIYHYTRKGKMAHCQFGYHWVIDGDKALELLELIRPYLIVKIPQADLAIEFQTENIQDRLRKYKYCYGVPMDILERRDRAYHTLQAMKSRVDPIHLKAREDYQKTLVI